MTDLAPAWVEWVTDNGLRGAARADLVAGLVRGGLDPERAALEVDRVLGSPIFTAARRAVRRSAGVEQAARLRRWLDPEPVAEVAALDEALLHRAFWTANRPVVFRGGAAAWPAARWTWSGLADRFGPVEVDVLVGRADRARWWTDREAVTRRIPFAQLVSTCLSTMGDDVYADGRAGLLAVPELAPLAADFGTLPGLVGDGFPRLWVGPAGTVTPVHHDQSTGWLVQLLGHKRVWFASPLEPSLMETTDGLYNRVDPRAPPADSDVAWHEVVIGPTDAVLVPVGWWHMVVALEPSISVSMGGFRWPNVATWYTPGRAGT
ncbi:MAG: cupin-like domain-containing protein [Myxococcota bacterium]